MLTKTKIVDKIEKLENGCVQVRTAIRVMENGEILSQSFHRHVVSPGNDYSQEDPMVQAVCAAIHTPEVIAAYLASTNPQAQE